MCPSPHDLPELEAALGRVREREMQANAEHYAQLHDGEQRGAGLLSAVLRRLSRMLGRRG